MGLKDRIVPTVAFVIMGTLGWLGSSGLVPPTYNPLIAVAMGGFGYLFAEVRPGWNSPWFKQD